MTRVWPPITSRLMCLVLIVAGTFGVVAGIFTGNLIVAGISALVPLLGARLVGWVEIEGDNLRHRRLIGDSTVLRFSDVREVGLGMHQVRKSKWWYPEVETKSGESIKFLMLKSLSGKDTIARIEKIFATGMAALPDKSEDEFTTVTTSGDLEFLLTPGYDEFKRERAEAVQQSQQSGIEFGLPQGPAIEPAVAAPVVPVAPERHLRLMPEVAPELLPSPEEPAPEVFEPRSWNDPEPQAARPVLVPPPVPQKIPTVIETPAAVAATKIREEEPARQFTSLFSRAA